MALKFEVERLSRDSDSAVSEVVDRLIELEREVEKKDDEIEALKADIEERDGEIEALQGKVADLVAQLAEAKAA